MWSRIWIPDSMKCWVDSGGTRTAVRADQGSGSTMGRGHDHHLGTLASGMYFLSRQEPGVSVHTCVGWAAGSVASYTHRSSPRLLGGRTKEPSLLNRSPFGEQSSSTSVSGGPTITACMGGEMGKLRWAFGSAFCHAAFFFQKKRR